MKNLPMSRQLPGMPTTIDLLLSGGAFGRGWLRATGKALTAMQAVATSGDAAVGLTPKEAIWTLNKATLYRYHPTLPESDRHPVPLLLVYALINRPFIFDLGPGRSFVEHLLNDGFDLYLLDWGSPGLEDQATTFDDYVAQYLVRAVRKVRRNSGAQEISLLGYCIGATLTCIYAAAYPDIPVRNLVLLTPPLDFSGPPQGSMAMWVQQGRLDVDRLVDSLGNIPGELVREWAKLIKPMENYLGSYLTLMRSVEDPHAVQGWQAVNRWVEDVIPFAGEAFRQFVKDYVWANALVSGHHRVDGRRVDLANIRANLLTVVAQYDHLVAPSQSEGIMHRVSSQDKTYRAIPSTHVGIMASRRAKEKLWPELVTWLKKRSD